MNKLISLKTYGGRLVGLDDKGVVWTHTSKNVWQPMEMNGLEVPAFPLSDDPDPAPQFTDPDGEDTSEEEVDETEDETDEESEGEEQAGVTDPDE